MIQIRMVLAAFEQRLNGRLTNIEARLGDLEAKRANQIGFGAPGGTYPVGHVDAGHSCDDQERVPGSWVGDNG